MKNKNDFALVPRLPGALEKAGQGKSRIISSMVVETLALVRHEHDEREMIYQRGLKFERRGERGQAFASYKQAAERGHGWAQYKLGQCYLDGEGVRGNEREGIAWLKQALDGGLGRAGFVLGNYFNHLFLPNHTEAIDNYRKAAELGDEHAAFNLASVLERIGKAGETSTIQRTAEQGDSAACFEMGMRSLEGLGISQSTTEAFRWFHKAAEQGDDADAWSYMGFMLENGIGVPPDLNEAIGCLRRASELGNDVAYNRLVELNALD